MARGDQPQQTSFRSAWAATRVSEVPSWFERSVSRAEQPVRFFFRKVDQRLLILDDCRL
jgi:hypothetical protein